MTPEQLEQLRKLRGCIGSVVTSGNVETWFAKCHEDARSYHDRNGLHSIEYRLEDARFVERGRDTLAMHMMQQGYDYLIMCDADATFPQDAFVRLLNTAYFAAPDSDMVGAYIQLKGSGLPAIDTGTGQWEVHFPGEGVIPVIRTGGHFFLTKRSAYEKCGPPPWYRTREAPRALDALAEVDGYARQHHSGKNPFAQTDEWKDLLTKAVQSSQGGKFGVGEDSAFCDLLKSRGGLIYVDTDIVTGHIQKEIIGPDKLKKGVEMQKRQRRLVVGLWD